jgi:hypothetical protein
MTFAFDLKDIQYEPIENNENDIDGQLRKGECKLLVSGWAIVSKERGIHSYEILICYFAEKTI